ncbi:hypothetical protein [Pedosphaera parvula]|uniref:Uncharacterized protein n=1 Tax=Pedosphaera parvula (strain Ellin514) TaxID=320771 RepID=B9XS55_PEDPL|nr:hypothetical protein [Pedosphaera parvula]EEF57310.1 hypothetical protein Cflav_PD0319 [Pedosphaera parvula Ellin514]
MLSRLVFLVITLFWVAMTLLLWRSEYMGKEGVGTSAPMEMVWQKILTAPDNSSLEISHHGQKIGYCRWAAIVGQDLTSSRTNVDEVPPEGMVEFLSNYRIDFEGNVALGEASNRLRFDFSTRLSTNYIWQDFVLRLYLRPSSWEIKSQISEESIHLKIEDGSEKSERSIKFADLQNPEFLMREFELPVPIQLLGTLGIPAKSKSLTSSSLGLKWEARNDWFHIGHTSVKAYRLEAKVLDRYKILVFVSQVGEILRVELPDEVVLVNDQLTNL